MAINVVHAVQGGDRFWGVVVPGGIAALPTRFPTTAALIAGGEAEWRAAAARGPDLRLEDLTVSRHRAVPGDLPGRELPPAHDRVRAQSG
jgi:hypothetical protein